MPYARNADLPKPVRDALPKDALAIWRNAFNSVEANTKNEGRAAAGAWAAVKRAGYQKDEETGKWRKVSKGDDAVSDATAWIRKDETKRYTLGVVYEPDVVDAQGDFADAEEIEKAAWLFLRNLQGGSLTKAAMVVLDAVMKALEADEPIRLDVTDLAEDIVKGGGLNDMHESTPWDDQLGDIVECYIAPCDVVLNGETVRKGTWLMGVVWAPEEFAKVEAGERIGYSMEGVARRVAAS